MEDLPATAVVIAEQQKIVNIEHPGVVKSTDNAVKSLGGENTISRFLQSDDPGKRLKLSLNPNDPFRRPINSHMKSASDVLLKFSVPKRTGRKRKRASNTDFELDEHSCTETHSCSHLKSRQLMRSLRDNPNNFKVKAIGLVKEAFRFRNLPDFQYSVAGSPLAESIKSSILPFQYDKMKQFQFDMNARGIKGDMDMIPPPIFSQMNTSFRYAYHQNPHVESVVDQAGKQSTGNTNVPPSTSNTTARPEDLEVPQGPPDNLPPIETLDESLQEAIRQLEEIMKERPIVTRRVVVNKLKHQLQMELRYAVKYHAYLFRSGPWRDCFVKYGLDPRKDPQYRIYQTLMFHIPIKDEQTTWMDGRSKWARSQDAALGEYDESHIFDGKTLIPDSKIWQACDVTDPLLRRILDEDEPSETFNALQDGWYNNGTWAKVRVIMRDKITLILAGVEPKDSDYEKYVALPNIITKESDTLEDAKRRQREGPLSADIRNLAKQSIGKLQDRRLRGTISRPKMT